MRCRAWPAELMASDSVEKTLRIVITSGGCHSGIAWGPAALPWLARPLAAATPAAIASPPCLGPKQAW